jgi:hypothetical protein
VLELPAIRPHQETPAKTRSHQLRELL